MVRREEKRRGAESRLGSGDGDAVCNNPKIGSFRGDDLLFYPCLIVREIKGQEIAGSEIEFSLIQKKSREESVMKEKSKGVKESKKAPQKSLKEKRKEKKEKKNR
jgi:hypothetical protein